MVWLSQLHYRTRTLFGRDSLERGLDDELQFHLEMQTTANIGMGMSPRVARTAAERQFGSISRHKDAYRERWGARQLETLWQDARHAVRHALSHRATSLAVILVLALGIGAGTAVFNVLYAVLINPLPLADPGRLVRLHARAASQQQERLLSAPEVRDLRAHVPSLGSVAEFHYMYFILLDGDEPQRVSAGVVSSNFFDVIGVRPIMGRTFTAREEQPGAEGVIIVSHRYWQEQLAGDPGIVGRRFQMNDRAHRVVGVLPPLPSFPEQADIYLPTAACPLRISVAADQDRSLHLVSVLGRLAPREDATERAPYGDRSDDLSVVQHDLDTLTQRLSAAEPTIYRAPADLSVVPVHDDITGRFRPTMSVLAASTLFLLLTLCVSVGALMVATTLKRRENLLLMTALGISRGRLFRQFATEALVLAVGGSLLGLVLAWQTVPILASLAARFTPRAVEIRFDQTSLWFAAVVAVVVSVLIGAIVTMTAASSLRGTDGLGHRRHVSTRPRLFKALVVVHIAVSFVLLVGAGLMLRSLVNLERIDTGYRTDNVLTMRLSSDFIEYPNMRAQSALFLQVLATLERTPAVTSVGISGALPLAGAGNLGEDTVEVDGPTAPTRVDKPLASLQSVSPGYFTTVGLAVRQGRLFTADDRAGADRVVIVNEGMARRYWNERSAVGRRLRVGEGEWATVVGVVADARQRLSEPPMDEVYWPLAQLPLVRGLPTPQVRIFVRGTLPAEPLEAVVRAAIREAAPRQPVDSVLPLTVVRDQSLAPMRVTTTLVGIFAAIALAISAIGLSGVAGASVSMRTRAFGLQMALGATRWRLLLGVLREGVALGVAGLMCGAALSVLLTRSLDQLLFEVTPYDPATFAAVAGVLMLTTVAACVAPARRAAMVDPCVALRA